MQALAQGNIVTHINSAVTSRGKGIAIFALSTSSNREFRSSTNDFINQSNAIGLDYNPCSVCVTKVLNEDAGTNVSCTVELTVINGLSPRNTRTASLFATFK